MPPPLIWDIVLKFSRLFNYDGVPEWVKCVFAFLLTKIESEQEYTQLSQKVNQAQD